MKFAQLLAALLGLAFFLLAPSLQAQEKAESLINPARIEVFRQKAFEFLKTKRPDLKPENLVFSGFDYRYSPGVAPELLHDQRGEHLSNEPPFTQGVYITFEDRTTRTMQMADGEVVAVTKIFSVRFNAGLTECLSIDEETSTKTIHAPPPDQTPP